MHPAVTLVSSELLKPAHHPDGQQKFELTAFDRFMKYARYQKRILFYAPPLDVALDLIKLLKDSLRDALVSFYPLAGRITVVPDPSIAPLELDCSELSVRFSEAVTKATLAELGDFEPSEFCDSLCDFGSCPPAYPWKLDHPLLYVQVTKFRCGGIGLGVGFSHQAMDGVSAWHFISSWAEVARTGSLSMPPETFYSHEVIKLTAEEVSQVLVEDGKSKYLGPAVKQPLIQDQMPELRTQKFLLDKDMIEKLKSEVAAGETRFSTFEVVCAHFWRRITRATALPVSKFAVLVNCRGRVKSIPKSYFGNAIASFEVTAKGSELVERDISYAASLLHAAILEFTPKMAERKVAMMDSLINDGRFVQLVNNFRPFVQVVGSPRHPIYECDFGFGKPVNVTVGTNDLSDEKFYLFPSPKGDGGISAMVVLQPEAMQRFLDDHD